MKAGTGEGSIHEVKVGTPVESILGGLKVSSGRVILLLTAAVLVSMSLFHLFVGWSGAMDPYLQRVFALTLSCVGVFLLRPLGRKSWRDQLNWRMGIDIVLMLACVSYFVYVLSDYGAFLNRLGAPTAVDIVLGSLLFFTVLEAARRAGGIIIPIIAGGLVLLNMLGPYLPGVFRAPPVSWSRTIEITVLADSGIFSDMFGVFTGYLVLFMIFAAFLLQSRGAEIFNNLAQSVAGRYSGGPAKVAVFSSSLVGTITGMPAANVATVGCVTIPMMKNLGYKPHLAAAIEAAASTGSIVMPPIMGTGAFLMAYFLGIPYWKVAVAAIIPAAGYYIAVFSAVHFIAHRDSLRGLPPEQIPRVGRSLVQTLPLLVPLATLSILMVLGFGMASSAIWTIILTLVMTQTMKHTRWAPKALLLALEDGGKMCVSLGALLGCIGIIYGAFWVSGIQDVLVAWIVQVSHGYLLIALVITALVALVLGMGVGATPVYLLVAGLGVPALVQMGATPLAAHFFAFYWGMMAAITPPVAIAVFAAMAISGSGLWKTGLAATMIAFPAFFIPFAFVFYPELLGQGEALRIALGVLAVSLANIVIPAGWVGYMRQRLGIIERIALVVGGIFLLFFMSQMALVGLALVLVPLFRQFLRPRPRQTGAVP